VGRGENWTRPGYHRVGEMKGCQIVVDWFGRGLMLYAIFAAHGSRVVLPNDFGPSSVDGLVGPNAILVPRLWVEARVCRGRCCAFYTQLA
jgi:hypothetical protein